MVPKDEISLRQLSSHADYAQCVELQKETWGKEFSEIVPPSILMVSQKLGGVAAGAFDSQGKMLGFAFGMTGFREGRVVHWSDMLATRPGYRDRGIGLNLKLFQREILLGMGIEIVFWTFDPLVARNAHFNLNRLGAEVVEYVPNMYADDAANELSRGLGMDRFVVRWSIASERVKTIIAGKKQTDNSSWQAAIVNSGASLSAGDYPHSDSVRIEIPADIQIVQERSLAEAAQWRTSTRQAFTWHLDHDYHVTGFFRKGDRAFYCLMPRREV